MTVEPIRASAERRERGPSGPAPEAPRAGIAAPRAGRRPDLLPGVLENRVTDLLGVRYPIVQAPMGWIARAQLASAVSEGGRAGHHRDVVGRALDEVRDEIRKMRDLTDKPFGVNIAQLFVRDPAIVEFVVDQGVRFVTTSAPATRPGTRPSSRKPG